MPLALEIEFLLGRYVATSAYAYDEPEWPPHPDRVYSALVAAWCEALGTSDQAGRRALDWLASQDLPSIGASHASFRDLVSAFVPVNDRPLPQMNRQAAEHLGRNGVARHPGDDRERKERSFPAAVPEVPIVHYMWPLVSDGDAQEHVDALQRIARDVSYLGHSTSPVRACFRLTAPEEAATWVPSPRGDVRLRGIGPDRLGELRALYENGQPVRPAASASYVRTREPAGTPTRSHFDEMIVFRLTGGPRLPLSWSALMTTAVREALMALADQPVAEVLSGHTVDGARTENVHAAVVPMPFVDYPHADGRLLGFAVVLPEQLSYEDRRAVYRAAARLEVVRFGNDQWPVSRVPPAEQEQLASLHPGSYVGPARHWATITPVVLDRHPKPKGENRIEEVVRRSCERIGLPAPAGVFVLRAPVFTGLSLSGQFRRPVGKGYLDRPWKHVLLEFDELVRGPVVIGAGRYLGLGLMRRLDR